MTPDQVYQWLKHWGLSEQVALQAANDSQPRN